MRAVWMRRVGLSLSLALALGYLPYRVYRNSGLSRYIELKAELAKIVARNQRLGREALRLRAELEPFTSARWNGTKHDATPIPLDAVERAAREELGLVRPGEVVFQVTPEARP